MGYSGTRPVPWHSGPSTPVLREVHKDGGVRLLLGPGGLPRRGAGTQVPTTPRTPPAPPCEAGRVHAGVNGEPALADPALRAPGVGNSTKPLSRRSPSRYPAPDRKCKGGSDRPPRVSRGLCKVWSPSTTTSPVLRHPRPLWTPPVKGTRGLWADLPPSRRPAGEWRVPLDPGTYPVLRNRDESGLRHVPGAVFHWERRVRRPRGPSRVQNLQFPYPTPSPTPPLTKDL